MRVRRGLTTVVALALVACSADPASAPTSAPTTAVVATTTTQVGAATTSTSVSPTTAANTVDDLAAQFTTDDLPFDEPCSMGDAPIGGQVTFVTRSKLWAIDADGTVSCLADLEGRAPTWISWSPDGDEVLVGPDTVLRNDGRFVSTGYFPDNRSLRWSYPTGKALIAPNAATGNLIWRNAHDSSERIDVSFIERTTVAAYHPAGKHIAAAGTDAGTEGIFIASNRGANMQPIGQIESGEVTDLAFEESGDSIVFVHRHADGVSELHRYTFSTSLLDTIPTVVGEQVSDLVTSPVDQSALAWATSHSTLSSSLYTQIEPIAAPVRVEMPAESVVRPVGWLPHHTLLIARDTPPASIDSTFDLWQWSGGVTTHLVDGVSAAATRTVHGPYLELNIIVGSGFG